MPRGAQPGERRGGRGKGSLNKKTLARMADEAAAKAAAEAIAAEIHATPAVAEELRQKMEAARPTPRGKDELAGLMPIIRGHVAQFQRAAIANDGLPGGEGHNPALWKTLKEWITLLADVCNKAADFQDPRYRAIAVAVQSPGVSAEAAPLLVAEASEPRERDRRAGASYLRLVK